MDENPSPTLQSFLYERIRSVEPLQQVFIRVVFYLDGKVLERFELLGFIRIEVDG